MEYLVSEEATHYWAHSSVRSLLNGPINAQGRKGGSSSSSYPPHSSLAAAVRGSLQKALLSIEKNLRNVATGATFRSAAKRRVPQKGLDEEGNDLITKSMHRKIVPVLSLDLPCLIFSLSPSSFLGVMSIIRSITPDFPPDLGLTFPVKTECEEGECMSAERLLSWAPMQRECILNCSSPKLCIPSIRPTLPVFSDSWTCTAHTSQVFGPALCN